MNPSTPYFKTHITRRGIIPAGLAEIIVISFYPTEYQYYYDYIRLFCEGENLIIPIHAYPAIDMALSRYVPRNLDFGVVPEDGTDEKEIEITNTVDIPFEFEVVPVLTCPEIKVNQLYGKIPASGAAEFEFRFNPKKKGIFVAEYEFHFAEFEKKPDLIRITGSCNDYSAVVEENIATAHKTKRKQPDFNETKEIIKIEDTIKLDSTEREGIKVSEDRSSKRNKNLTKRFKYVPSNKEREFLNYFNEIDETIKSKEIKYTRFIGKPLPTQAENEAVIKERQEERDFLDNVDRKNDINRNKAVFEAGRCIQDKQSVSTLNSEFDPSKNDRFFKKRHFYNKFLGFITKLVVRNRAERRLNKLEDMIVKVNH